uniref:Uncharacterized protein n=1 Tax=Pyrodinium bahamense TaxID=73915 RepID=A0A7R9ZXC1_9DINO|eukprot:CAMPEP_0179089566 /NCGR_PEP_ID=MMETSP0796-20121207/40818_1 /TAXON_ID=73915 /ORGANISM="Pyrodinium bahamense, Strain pbaha01" /LENGTH=220 /DNA_ID=CAMNT_0020787125 /DNA_START=101 /DNA_END=763 /DNA_ORIENTATION=-
MGGQVAPVSCGVGTCTGAVVDQLPEGCSARPCCGPASPGADKQVILNSRLLAASTDGDLAGIRKAIGSGADIETRKPMVIRPRCMKVPQEAADDPLDLPAVLGLGQENPLRHGSGRKVILPPDAGLTPLMRAAKEGRAKAVALLLQLRAAPHAKDEDGMTALHFAAAAGCRETCEVLLRAGANPLQLDDGKRDAYASLPQDSIVSRKDQAEWKAILRSHG